MAEQLAQSKYILSKLFDDWDRNASQYGELVYESACVRSGTEWQTLATRIVPSRLGVEGRADFKADYGSLLIVRGHVPLEEAKATLTNVIEQGRLRLPDIPETALAASLHVNSGSYWGSQTRRSSIEYPSLEYRFSINGNHTSVGQALVHHPNLLLYPSADVAIEDLLGIRIPNPGAPELIAIIPDYRARICKVQLSRTEVSVTVEICESSAENVIGKAYCEDAQGRRHHFDLDFQDNVARFPASGFPRRVIVALLERDGSGRIDEWFYDANAQFNAGVEIERIEEDIENLILAGESEKTEFKEKLTAGYKIAISISALANAGGGKILVGVSDDGEVVGCDQRSLADQLARTVKDHCDPAPAFTVTTIQARDKSIQIIDVPEGTDKPYPVKDKGVYIRNGATNRQATRYELDLFWAAKSSPERFW